MRRRQQWSASALERFASILILALGVLHALLARNYVNADGVSYIDIAGNWLRLGKAAANGYFSPLYSWALLLPLAFRPSMQWEGALVHALNFALLAAALLAFRWFFHELGAACAPASQRAFVLVGYSLFAWSALRMITVAMVAPDMLYAALMFLLAGLLLRIFGGARGWSYALALGLLWGLGFLARAAALPVIAVSALACFFAFGKGAGALGRLALASAVAALVVAPWIIVLSNVKGHWTLGSTGPLNYAWQVNQRPWEHARDPGMPHPTRKIAGHPSVYEFATPIVGTYPPWTDPSYWDEGLRMTIDLKTHAIFIAKSLLKLGSLGLELGALLAALFVLWSARAGLAGNWRALAWLLAISLTGIGIYAALNVEPRYFGAFWTILWLCLWAAIRTHEGKGTWLTDALAAGVAFVTILALTHFTLNQISLAGYYQHDLRTAQRVAQEGVEQGAKIATIALDNDVYWARLARLRIIAEIPSGDALDFWSSSPARRAEILELLRQQGVRYVFASQVPPGETAWKAFDARPMYLLTLPN